jgi:GNAT superfamily N-acetyltransferase
MSEDIRPVTAQDIPALLPLVEQYWVFEDIAGFDPARVGRELARACADPTLASGWIACAKGGAVGYLLAVYVFSLEHLGLTAEIDEFFVLPSARGKGIGDRLLGLAEAEFLRWGSIHRNSYLNAPAALAPHLALRDDPRTLFAGQLTGVEGYTESTATGLLAAINLARMLAGDDPVIPPPTTMLGALYRYLREADPRHFQPMNANFGLVDELPERVRDKRRKRELIAERALREMERWIEEHALVPAER